MTSATLQSRVRNMDRLSSARFGFLPFLALLLMLAHSTVAQQKAGKSNDFKLKIDGDVAKPLEFSMDELAKLPQREARAKEHDGSEHVYRGVAISDLLQAAGVAFGDQLRGANLARFLLVQAADGYRAVFALPELDPAFTEGLVLLVYSRDGAPLSEKDGPLRIVVPREKRQARWVRQVIALTMRRA